MTEGGRHLPSAPALTPFLGEHSATYRREPAGRDRDGNLGYRWTVTCACGWTWAVSVKRLARNLFLAHAYPGGAEPAAPAVARAVTIRLALEQVRRGLVAALLNPDPRALRPRCAELADLLTDVLDGRWTP